MQLLPATLSDAAQLTTLYFAAFSIPLNLAMFPRTPDNRAWWEAFFKAEIERMQQGKNKMLWKVIDSSAPNAQKEGEEIVAFAMWKLPRHEADKDDNEDAQFPPNGDQDLCQRFFSAMDRNREKYMSSRLHYCNYAFLLSRFVRCIQVQCPVANIIADLEIIATHPAHEGRGFASLLLRWGLQKADDEGLPVFLSASPTGRVVYERRGFRVVGMEDLTPDYKQAYMVREPTSQ